MNTPAVFELPITVTDAHIDELGHVNNLAYLRWILDAAVAHSDAAGWTAQRYLEIGAAWVVRSHFIEYLMPAFAGDELIVQTWVSSFQKVRSTRNYRILRPRDAGLLANAETNWAFIDLQHRVPTRIPDEIAERFPVVTDPPPL